MSVEPYKTMSIRLAASLHAKIKAEARQTGLSANAWIARTLSDHFVKQELTAEIVNIKERLDRVEKQVFGEISDK